MRYIIYFLFVGIIKSFKFPKSIEDIYLTKLSPNTVYKRSQIGLAVGDIEAVQQNARLKRLAMQVISVIATNCKK